MTSNKFLIIWIKIFPGQKEEIVGEKEIYYFYYFFAETINREWVAVW